MAQKLIFDLGFHNGDDTDFYLKKGAKVIAVEANPYLVEIGQRRFQQSIDSGQLVLLNRAIVNCNQIEKVDFYIHPTKDNWSSCFKSMAESDGSSSTAIKVPASTLNSLVDEFGIPYYMKVDIEGMDTEVAKQLFYLPSKPESVSFEISKTEYATIFAWLHLAGYLGFQLINQQNHINYNLKPTDNAREGNAIEYNFGEHSSGIYGKDLNEQNWVNYDALLTKYIKYKELKYLDNINLALGWVDVHARLEP